LDWARSEAQRNPDEQSDIGKPSSGSKSGVSVSAYASASADKKSESEKHSQRIKALKHLLQGLFVFVDGAHFDGAQCK